jgi:hypothetical protein
MGVEAVDDDWDSFFLACCDAHDVETWRRYVAMREAGQSHNMAEMLATRSFPGTKGTDRAFMQGRYSETGGAQFARLPKRMGQQYVDKALAAGVNPTGKWYSGALARYPGDPKAWVDGLSDVRRVAEERGAEVSGAIEVKPPQIERPDPGPYQVAPDIIARRLADRLATEPELSEKDRGELVHEMTEKSKGTY